MNQMKIDFDIRYWLNKIVIVFLYIAPILLMAMYDFAFVTYDSEPDYISSAFHISEYGIPFNSSHPGTVTQYLVSIPLLFSFYFELSIDIAITLMRLTELGVMAMLLWIGINIMGITSKTVKVFCYSLIWFLIFIYPSTSVVFRYLSAEILLFGLSFLLCALWYRHLQTEEGVALLSLIVGIGMNVKPTFIFLLIVLSSFHLLHYACYSKLYKGIQAILKIFIYGAMWFVVFSIPKIFQILLKMLDLSSGWYDLIGDTISVLSILNYLIIFIFLLLLVFLFYLSIKYKVISKNKSNLINVMIREGWVIALPVAIFVFYKLFYYFIHPEIDYLVGLEQWESLGIMRRNSVPLYAFLVFIVIKIISVKFSNFKFYNLSLSLIFLFLGGSISISTASKGYIFENKHNKLFDQSLMKIKNNNKNSSIFIHRDNYFDSIAQFQLWTNIRYGNCNDEKLNTMLKSTYSDIDISGVSYISAFTGILDCHNKKNNTLSFYDMWLETPNNVIKVDICNRLDDLNNDKIFLLDSRYIDWDDPNEIISDLNLVIKSCGYKMHRNREYFHNNKIMAFDFIKS